MQIQSLRQDWQQQVDDFDAMIDALEHEQSLDERAVGNHAISAHQAWLRKLQAWRTELQELLEKYPD